MWRARTSERLETMEGRLEPEPEPELALESELVMMGRLCETAYRTVCDQVKRVTTGEVEKE
jgi:hypothetical protein